MSTAPAALADLLTRLAAGPPGAGAPDLGMPAWLAQVVTALFEGQEAAARDGCAPDGAARDGAARYGVARDGAARDGAARDGAARDGGARDWSAHDWVARLHAAVVRLEARVPFTVVHHWHARTVAPLLGDVCPDQAAAGALHARALAGAPVTEAEWAAALEPALREVYRRAYAYDEAYRVNYDSAHAYGIANDFGAADSHKYAAYYAELATGANLRACADANAIAGARACAAAFARADPAAYARTYPYAAARAYARALANGAGGAPEPAAYVRLAEGLTASLIQAA